MSNSLIILLIILGFVALIAFYYAIKKYWDFKKAKKGKKDVKEKQSKVAKKEIKRKKRIEQRRNREDEKNFEGASMDIEGKFLYSKEMKILSLINHILPKGYVAFPKVLIGLILTPVGNRNLYDSVKNNYLDLVIFEESTMQPKIAIDLFDGSLGDEQLNFEHPNVIKALKLAELPILEIKVKITYTEEEIKTPIFKLLGIKED